jgi:hypothetical protein
MMVGLDSNNDAIFVRLRRAIWQVLYLSHAK